MMQKTDLAFDVFLSYSHADAVVAEEIARFLSDKGVSIWFDRWTIVPGEAFSNAISAALEQSENMLVIIGKKSVTTNQAFELGMWQGMHRDRLAIGALLPGASQDAPVSIPGTSIVDLRSDLDDLGFARILDKIRSRFSARQQYLGPVEVPDISGRPTFDEAELRSNIDQARRAKSRVAEALAMNELAELLKSSGRKDEALSTYRNAIAILQSIGERVREGVVRTNLAGLMRETGRFEDSEAEYRVAIGILTENDTSLESVDLGAAYNNLAGVLAETSRLAEAKEFYRRAIDIALREFGSRHPNYAAAISNFASILVDEGRLEEAESYYREALAVFETSTGPDSTFVSTAMVNLAELLRDKGSFEEAIELYRRSIAIIDGVKGSSSVEFAVALHGLAAVLAETGAYPEALSMGRVAASLIEKARPNDVLLATVLGTISAIQLKLGNVGKAEEVATKALKITEDAYPDRSYPAVGIRLSTVANVFVAQGRLREAAEAYSKALAILEKTRGVNSPDTKTAQANLELVKAKLSGQDVREP